MKNVHLISFENVLDSSYQLFPLALPFSTSLERFSVSVFFFFLPTKEFTLCDQAALGSARMRADGALLLPPCRALPPAAPALSTVKHILELELPAFRGEPPAHRLLSPWGTKAAAGACAELPPLSPGSWVNPQQLCLHPSPAPRVGPIRPFFLLSKSARQWRPPSQGSLFNREFAEPISKPSLSQLQPGRSCDVHFQILFL